MRCNTSFSLLSLQHSTRLSEQRGHFHDVTHSWGDVWATIPLLPPSQGGALPNKLTSPLFGRRRGIRTPTSTSVNPRFSRPLPLPRIYRLSLPLFGGVAGNRTRNSCLQGKCDPNFTTTPMFGLHGRIRTYDNSLPRRGLYQTELRTDCIPYFLVPALCGLGGYGRPTCLVLVRGLEPLFPELKARSPSPVSRHQHGNG